MNDETVRRVHWSFWVIGAVALIWNVLGGVNFFVQMNADVVTSFPETARAIIEGRPAWATGGFAIAVFGGALGCLSFSRKIINVNDRYRRKQTFTATPSHSHRSAWKGQLFPKAAVRPPRKRSIRRAAFGQKRSFTSFRLSRTSSTIFYGRH